MSNKYLIADLHFGGKNTCKWKDAEGNYVRPWRTQEEHDQALIQLWNETVKPQDKVYVLGDFAMSKRALIDCGTALNGHKRLISGNHDINVSTADLGTVFDKVYGVITARTIGVELPFVLSHVPVHPDCLNRKSFSNCIHGHTHDYQLPDPRYLCVSVEQIDYKPILVEDAWQRLLDRQSQNVSG